MRRLLPGYYGALALALLGLAAGCTDDTTAASERSDALVQSDRRDKDDEELRATVVPFAALRLFLEFNSSANDLGVQLLLDSDAWKRVSAFDPGMRQILEIEAAGRLKELGLTELVFESDEPEPAEVLGLFPAGSYRFEGRTLDQEKLVGTATLSHALPPAPVFSPSSGQLVDRNNTVVTWTAIPGIASYQVIVESDAVAGVFTVDLLPPVTSVQVPPTFLKPNTPYKIEVLAVATNGNRTITEGTFVTRP